MTVRSLALRLVSLTAALSVAACGGGGPTSAPLSAIPTEAPGSSVVVPTFDLGTFVMPSFALPSFTSDEELEALLPDTIGGEAVIKQSLSGSAILNSGFGGAEALEKTLGEVDATIDDVSVAIGVGGTAIVLAYQIDGVPADRIFDGLLDGLQSGGGGEVTERTVSGRSVTEVVAAGETTYIYLAGDVVFIIGGEVTPELLADAVAQLPAD